MGITVWRPSPRDTRAGEAVDATARQRGGRLATHQLQRGNVRWLGTHSANDIALRGGADEIERIAGDQCDRLLGRGIEHRHVLGIDNPRSFDAVDLCPLKCFKFDRVPDADVLQAAEEAVAMSGNAGVAARAWHRGLFDVTHAPIQRDVARSRQHRHDQMDAGNAKHGERHVTRQGQCTLPCGDALW